MNFQYFSIKIKIFQTFCESQTASCLAQIIQASQFHPHPLSRPDKMFFCLCNKNFLMEIYRNIRTFVAFQVLLEYNSRASRKGAPKVFFSETNQKNLKMCKVRKVFASSDYIFSNAQWVEVCKMRLFKQNCILK